MNAPAPIRDDRIRDFDFELDQMLMELVLRDHPEWQPGDVASSFPAWLEVQRLRADADQVELLTH